MSIYKAGIEKLSNFVITDQSYFASNLPALGQVMRQIYDIQICSQMYEDLNYFDNPLDFFDQVSDRSYKDLIEDAWSYAIDQLNRRSFGRIHPLTYKTNKTYNDFKLIYKDNYTDTFPTELSILNHIFCVTGNGLQWTKDGFIDNRGETSRFKANRNFLNERSDFALPEELLKIVSDYKIKEQKEIDKKLKSYYKLNLPLTNIKQAPVHQETSRMSHHALLLSFPENVHSSYKDAMRALCEHIIRNEPSSNANHALATKALAKL